MFSTKKLNFTAMVFNLAVANPRGVVSHFWRSRE